MNIPKGLNFRVTVDDESNKVWIKLYLVDESKGWNSIDLPMRFLFELMDFLGLSHKNTVIKPNVTKTRIELELRGELGE